MGNELFTLLLTSNQDCIKSNCSNRASHILIGKDQQFLGFYCYEHGIALQELLESKYNFEKENPLYSIRKQRKVRRKK